MIIPSTINRQISYCLTARRFPKTQSLNSIIVVVQKNNKRKIQKKRRKKNKK